MGRASSPRLSALREAKRRLKEEEGVTSLLDEEDERLVIPVLGGLDLIFDAVCMDANRVRVVSVIRGVWGAISKFGEGVRLEILRKLLLIPADLKVAVSIDHDSDLVFEPWASSIGEASP